jgi:catechol 2,3-dioxygenase-like lactoylglutathione lyase family enzyme
MIGQLRSTVFDCPEPAELASFYCAVLGATVVVGRDDWVTIADGRGQQLSFQRSPGHEPPRFPDAAASQQLHLDIRVDDVDSAEHAALALGATRLDGESLDRHFRVFADPAGHPFCLVWSD